MSYPITIDIDLKRNTTKGVYLALEGIDGSGKTTQLEEIALFYQSHNREVVLTREPDSNGIVGALIRQALSQKVKIPTLALQYLFSADRAMHYQNVVIPALKKGLVVITDRCFWSAIPYGILDQAKNGFYDYTHANIILMAQGILSMYHQFIVPDYTFYLEISSATALQRIQAMHKEKELYETKEKLEKIIMGYQWLLKQFPKEIIAIDAEQSIDAVTKKIIEYVKI